MPMFVSKKVYILAIDGDYIHLMPSEHKGMFDSVKTVNDKRKKDVFIKLIHLFRHRFMQAL